MNTRRAEGSRRRDIALLVDEDNTQGLLQLLTGGFWQLDRSSVLDSNDDCTKAACFQLRSAEGFHTAVLPRSPRRVQSDVGRTYEFVRVTWTLA